MAAPVRLQTERLVLEPLVPEHAAAIQRINGDPRVTHYIGSGEPASPADTDEFIQRVMARWREWGYSWWALRQKRTGEIIGLVTLQHLEGNSTQPLELGWRLRPDVWGQGFATEAGREVIRFGFGDVGAPVLFAVANPLNIASHRVMQRLGMHYEGIRRFYDRNCTTYCLNKTRTSY